jgi:hypothetical protein
MVRPGSPARLLLGAIFGIGAPVAAQDQPGSIRGVVMDKDFDAPLTGAQIAVVETGDKAQTADQGNYSITGLKPGKYTLVFSKDGYVRQVRSDVIVAAGQLTDANAALAGEFAEMEEFVVQDTVKLGGSTEAGLLELRLESPALMDSISADLISKAGASDAAAALRLVAGATVQDGKSAVIRGLPDRYVSSQLNGVRLPTADEDKRAVELDQFPAVIIESVQVSKTFTPDQQGDASGGAVDVRLKGIPEEFVFQVRSQISFNTQVWDDNDYLSYKGGGLNFLGKDGAGRGIQKNRIGDNWRGAVGVDPGTSPIDYKWSMSGGGRHVLDDGTRIGGFASLFYERDSAHYDDGKDDQYWVDDPGEPMSPQYSQGSPGQGEFKTSLFDVTKSSQSVQWGTLATFGVASDEHEVNLSFLQTNSTEDTTTLAEDTRGKEYFFPGYDPNDPNTPGHEEPEAAPYLRTETLSYIERETETLQLRGRHELPFEALGLDKAAEFDWTVALSSATSDQPDKRQFGTAWYAGRVVGPIVLPAQHRAFKPSANFNLGNLQRIWQNIDEDAQEYSMNLKLPYAQWSGDEGYLKIGTFFDEVEREFDQDTFSNFGDNSTFDGEYEDLWSRVFPSETNHPITASEFDVDYTGEQRIAAGYAMLELPLVSTWKIVGGARLEFTEIDVTNDPEEDAVWFPPGATAPVQLNPGDADVDFQQTDLLPSIGTEWKPFEDLTLRASYNETIARQTFKELTPVLQQEFLGGPIFIGNPDLEMSRLQNYDLRVDFVPNEGGLLSASWFRKDIDDPIEYVQRLAGFNFTTPINFPEGQIVGYELEVRQRLGHLWEPLENLSAGANATLIDSEVTLSQEERDALSLPNIQAPQTHRKMTAAPEYLLNFYLSYELLPTGTQAALFYTHQGDTLITGAGQADGNFVPSVFAEDFGTLNFSLSQRLGEYFKVDFQAKNLTNPKIQTVYRSRYIGADVTRSSFRTGIELSLSLSAEVRF